MNEQQAAERFLGSFGPPKKRKGPSVRALQREIRELRTRLCVASKRVSVNWGIRSWTGVHPAILNDIKLMRDLGFTVEVSTDGTSFNLTAVKREPA